MTTANILSQLGSPGVSTGFKNRIINGAMVIDQRNAGASITPTVDGVYSLDRWITRLSQASKYSVQQVADAPNGFINSLKVTSLSAYSVNSTDFFQVGQYIEGLNAQDLMWGTSNAKTVTVSFWVKSSLTGTFGGTVFGYQTGIPSYPFSYTISAANTWEQKTITISGPTSGTFNTTNSGCFTLLFSFGVGSSLSGTANTWNYSTLYRAPTSAVSVVGTNAATFQITGVQLEVGTTATNFEVRSYGTELALCQRYFEKSYDITTAIATVTNVGRYGGDPGVHGDGTSAMTIFFKVAKRAPNYSAVTYSGAGTAGVMDYARSGASGTVGSAFDNRGQCSMLTYCTTGATAWTQTSVILFQWAVDSEL